MEINCIIFRILFAILFQFLIEEAPHEIMIIRDNYLVEVSFANWTLFVFEDKSQPQCACMANVLMVAYAKREELEWIETENAVIAICDFDSCSAHIAFLA